MECNESGSSNLDLLIGERYQKVWSQSDQDIVENKVQRTRPRDRKERRQEMREVSREMQEFK